MPTCQCKEGFYKFLEEGQERGQLEMAGCRKPSNEEIGDNVCNEFQELKCDFVSGGIKVGERSGPGPDTCKIIQFGSI